MNSRLTLRYVIVTMMVVAGVACGDDEGKEDSPTTGNAGATAGQSGSGGRMGGFGFGSGGRSGRGFGGRGAGRGLFGQMCPETEPGAGESCMPATGTCMFDSKICDCISGSSGSDTWACWSPSDCPTSAPAEQSSCPVVGMTCNPTRGEDCRCTAEGWDCGNQFCPASEPAGGSTCESGDGECTYGARTCDCDNSVWACWNQSDCPSTPPARGTACTLDGMLCPFEGGTCECNRSAMSGTMSWQCGRGVDVPDAPDSDAGT